MTGGYDVQVLFPELFEGVDSETAWRVASNFGSDAHEGREASRRDVELMLLLATGTITHDEFVALALADIGLPAETAQLLHKRNTKL